MNFKSSANCPGTTHTVCGQTTPRTTRQAEASQFCGIQHAQALRPHPRVRDRILPPVIVPNTVRLILATASIVYYYPRVFYYIIVLSICCIHTFLKCVWSCALCRHCQAHVLSENGEVIERQGPREPRLLSIARSLVRSRLLRHRYN